MAEVYVYTCVCVYIYNTLAKSTGKKQAVQMGNYGYSCKYQGPSSKTIQKPEFENIGNKVEKVTSRNRYT